MTDLKPHTAEWVRRRDITRAARDSAQERVRLAQEQLALIGNMVAIFVDCLRCEDQGTEKGGGCGLCGLRPGEHGGYEGRVLTK